MKFNPIRSLSRKVVDVTLASEVKRLRDVEQQQTLAVQACLLRESQILDAIIELCTDHEVFDHNGNLITSLSSFMDYVEAKAKVQK